ncbi:MAG: hypothetical protein LBR07_04710 [Puniceicoccales bacterium]|jgi:hypothetical protein|nr:hypothetical protein [Puniceicoccales bacterium]
MNSFSKILFGALLGVLACICWDFYQARQMEPESKPQAAVPAKKQEPTPKPRPEDTQKEKSAPIPPPVPPATPANPAEFVARLAKERWRWPQQVSLTSDLNIPLGANGQNGFIPITAGKTVDVTNIFPNGTLYVVYRVVPGAAGTPFRTNYTLTDLIGRALPEGTAPPPPPPVPSRRVEVREPERPRPPPEQPAPAPEPRRSPAPTLFGTPIETSR